MTTKMKIIVPLLLCLPVYGSSLFAQKTVIWKGGTPGRETQWQCPKNWLGNAVPNEFSDVLIPDISSSGMAYPVVNQVVEINALRLEGNTMLTIAPEGQLTVANDIFVAQAENLKGKGVLIVLNGIEKNNHAASAGKPDRDESSSDNSGVPAHRQ